MTIGNILQMHLSRVTNKYVIFIKLNNKGLLLKGPAVAAQQCLELTHKLPVSNPTA